MAVGAGVSVGDGVLVSVGRIWVGVSVEASVQVAEGVYCKVGGTGESVGATNVAGVLQPVRKPRNITRNRIFGYIISLPDHPIHNDPGIDSSELQGFPQVRIDHR